MLRQGLLCSLQANNVVVKTEGHLREEPELYNHVDLVQLLDIVDLESGTMVAGVIQLHSLRASAEDTVKRKGCLRVQAIQHNSLTCPQ